MSKLETDIKIGGRFWSTTTDGKIIDAEQIDGKLKMEQVEGLDPELLNSTNIEKGSGDGSNQTKDAIWNGGTQKDEENIIRVKDGDSVEGAIAEGFQSVAFGGKCYDKVRKNETLDTSRTPTTVRGNQSFAAGGSVTVEGDYSAGFGKDSKAYQRCSFVAGASEAGMTEDEFNEKYSVAVGSVTVPKYITIFTDTPSNNTNTENASVVYQYVTYTNNYNDYMASNNITSENIELEESATKTERFIYKKSTILGADSLTVPEYFAALRENVSLKAGNYTGKHKCSDYEGKWYDISYSFATAFGDKNKVEGRAQFASGVGLIANGIDGAAYVGKYNATSLNSYSLFTVGGGSSDSDRKSLLAVLIDGRLRLPNITETLTDNDVTRLKDVENLITEAITEIDRKFDALDSDFFNSIY